LSDAHTLFTSRDGPDAPSGISLRAEEDPPTMVSRNLPVHMDRVVITAAAGGRGA